MQKSNTKLHWTALAVARFYEHKGTACRVRDLYNLGGIDKIHETPTRLAACLHGLYKKERIDAFDILSPDKDGSKTRTRAYYPTNITIETLLDLGEPTELPDGTPINGDYDTRIPSERVDADEQPEPPQDNDVFAPEYDLKSRGSSARKKDPEPPEWAAKELPPIEAVLPHPDEEKHVCEYCGKQFDRHRQMTGHQSSCGQDDVDCPDCGRTFESSKAMKLHVHHTDCEMEPEDPVGRDLAYLEERTVEVSEPKPEWEWHDISQRLNKQADAAHDAGLSRISATYRNFASLAMERDLNESTGVETEAETILTKELVLMLLGVHHSQIDPDVIEDDDLSELKSIIA